MSLRLCEPGLTPPFDIDKPTFRQVLIAHLGELVPRDNCVPLGVFVLCAARSSPRTRCRKRKSRHSAPLRGIAHLWVFPKRPMSMTLFSIVAFSLFAKS